MPGLAQRLLRDEYGGTMVLTGASLAVLLGFAALSVDYARAISTQQLLSSAADAAALAAVSRLPDLQAAQKTAHDYVQQNVPAAQYGRALGDDGIQFGIWDADCRKFVPFDGEGDDDDGDGDAKGGKKPCIVAQPAAGSAPTAVEITVGLAPSNGSSVSTIFAWVFGSDTMAVSARAVAGRSGPPCIVALDPTGPAAFSLSGSARVQAVGCGVQVNSTATPALEIKGSGYLESGDICIGGTANSNSGATQSEPNEFCPALKDPMAGLEKPSVGACDHIGLSIKNDTNTLDPGVYCGGLDIGAGSEVTLAPGLYVIQDGPLSVAAKSTLAGSDVTIFLTGNDAVVDFKGKSIINLTAPTSGSMEGVLLFQDPDYGGTHDWKGKSTTALRGVIYFPSGTLVSKNDNAMTPEDSCVVLIADRLDFGASSGTSIDITQSNCRSALPGPYSRNIVLLQ